MLNFVRIFAASEDGAVTVDWVVLTAAVMTLGILILAQVQAGSKLMADGVQAELSKPVPTLDFDATAD
jgi:hypothetical protein